MQYRDTLGDTDGANMQARVLLELLRGYSVESSWNKELVAYDCMIDVNRYYNCREQGYTLTLRSKTYQQLLHVTFYEHRNLDCLCFMVYKGTFINPPTVDQIYALDGAQFKDKWSHSKVFEYGEWIEAAEYVKAQFESAYQESIA